MAYFSTATAPERRNVIGKNRVWDFFRLSNETHRANRRQPAQPRRKILPTATKPVSGIPYWPSRDPIEEEGGENLYGFVRNDGIDTWDLLGDLPAGVDERPSLEELLENYPGFDDIKNTPKSVWDRAGGNCKGLNDDNLKDPKSKGKDLDSCTMRMSLAFNGTQRDQIKKINGIRQILDGNRNRSIVAVRELESYLKSQWGNPDFDINDKSKDIGDWSGRIADTCAIVLYVKSDGRRFHVGFASHGKPTRDHTPSLRNVRAVVWRIPCQKTSICCCINSDWIDITSEGWDNRNAR